MKRASSLDYILLLQFTALSDLIIHSSQLPCTLAFIAAPEQFLGRTHPPPSASAPMDPLRYCI